MITNKEFKNELDELEETIAENNDRDVEEYRGRYPENVVAIDILRSLCKQGLIPEDQIEKFSKKIKKASRY